MVNRDGTKDLLTKAQRDSDLDYIRYGVNMDQPVLTKERVMQYMATCDSLEARLESLVERCNGWEQKYIETKKWYDESCKLVSSLGKQLDDCDAIAGKFEQELKALRAIFDEHEIGTASEELDVRLRRVVGYWKTANTMYRKYKSERDEARGECFPGLCNNAQTLIQERDDAEQKYKNACKRADANHRDGERLETALAREEARAFKAERELAALRSSLTEAFGDMRALSAAYTRALAREDELKNMLQECHEAIEKMCDGVEKIGGKVDTLYEQKFGRLYDE